MKCKRCGIDKDESDFWDDKRLPSGKFSVCKECGRNRSLEWRNKNLDRAQARARKWNQDHLELRARRERERRALNKEHQKELRKKWYQENKEKMKAYVSHDRTMNGEREHAHNLFKSAKRAGRIKVPSVCSLCGKKCRPVGHHPDYSKPFEVVWLCTNCHCMHHKGKYE